jgi:polar amino acid transport system substrate-binding protein
MLAARSLTVLALAGLTLAGCSQASDTATSASAPASASASCSADTLQTKEPGKLIIATGEPAYEPWVVNDKPESGEGFEAAFAYAAAKQLGYDQADVQWVRSTFDGAIAPGPKDFDWNIQQFTITPDRQKAVDFSSPYYQAPQAVITTKGSPIAGATTIAALKDATLGAAIGSTSLDAAQQVIAPTKDVQVFNDNAAAVAALKNEQIDGIVVDLPTGVYLVEIEVDGGTMVGTLPASDPYGILLAKGSPLTACTTQVVDQLREDGTLALLESTWLESYTSVPALS